METIERIKRFIMIAGGTITLCTLIFGGWEFLKDRSDQPQGLAPEVPLDQSQSASSSLPMPSESHHLAETAIPFAGAEHAVAVGGKDSSKVVALAFVQAYVTYDADQPADFLENSKPFMIQRLYEKEKRQLRRQTLEQIRTAYISAEFYPVDRPVQGEVTWDIVAVIESTGISGEKRREERSCWVSLLQVDGQWKVCEVEVH